MGWTASSEVGEDRAGWPAGGLSCPLNSADRHTGRHHMCATAGVQHPTQEEQQGTHQPRVGRDGAAHAAGPVGHLRRNGKLAHVPHTHALHAAVPACSRCDRQGGEGGGGTRPVCGTSEQRQPAALGSGQEEHRCARLPRALLAPPPCAAVILGARTHPWWPLQRPSGRQRLRCPWSSRTPAAMKSGGGRSAGGRETRGGRAARSGTCVPVAAQQQGGEQRHPRACRCAAAASWPLRRLGQGLVLACGQLSWRAEQSADVFGRCRGDAALMCVHAAHLAVALQLAHVLHHDLLACLGQLAVGAALQDEESLFVGQSCVV